MDPATEKYVREIAIALFKRAKEKFGNQWKKAQFDARYDNSGGSISKVRIFTESGSVSAGSIDAIDIPLVELDGCRRNIGPEWFGIVVSVAQNKECKIDFNYDSECVSDEAFFDD